MKNTIANLAVMLLLLSGCGKNTDRIPGSGIANGNDSIFGLVAADTIIYDVIIRNSNPDDAWAAHCLAGIHYSVLIDSIFNLVYTGRAVAYNHENNEKLTSKQLVRIESAKGFSRDNIGMIQFKEMWYLNPGSNNMTKQVISMVLGYNYYNPAGELSGYKPVFRVELSGDKGRGTRD